MMKQRLVCMVVIVTLCVMEVALAGFKTDAPVLVDDTSFAGSIGGARNTADDFSAIACGDDGAIVSCGATDSAGNTRICVTSDPNHMAIVRGMMTDSSSLAVEFDGTGTCTSMIHLNGSALQPKQHSLAVEPIQ